MHTQIHIINVKILQKQVFWGILGMNRKLFLKLLNLVLFSKGFFPLCRRDCTKIIWIKNSDPIKLSNSTLERPLMTSNIRVGRGSKVARKKDVLE